MNFELVYFDEGMGKLLFINIKVFLLQIKVDNSNAKGRKTMPFISKLMSSVIGCV